MSTSHVDNLVQGGEFAPVDYPIDTSGTYDFNQGDMLYFDTSAHFVKVVSSDATAAYFCGVAGEGPYIQVFSQKKYADRIPVLARGGFRFKTTAGETYYDGDAVYIGADAQTVSKAASQGGGTSNPVGVVVLAAGQTSLLAAATGFVEVKITARFPALTQ
jgi:hypothetical protein